MADENKRAARKKARIERRAGRYGFDASLEFGPQDEARFRTLMEKLNKGQMSDLSDEEITTFLNFTMNPPSQDVINKLTQVEGKEGITPERLKEQQQSLLTYLSSPANKNRVLEISRKQDLANKNTAYSNALGLMLSAADVASGQSQISEFRRRTKELKRPTRPGPMAVDPYLDAAKKAAERGTYGESIAAKAARQQAFDAYQQDLQNARVSSTGQAGGYGSLAQVATTRLGRRGAEMAPQIEAIRQGREQQRAQIAGLSAQENAARYKSMAEMYPYDLETYRSEAKSIGEMGQAGFLNRRVGLGELQQFAPLMYGNERINRKYQTLRDALTARGMSPEDANKHATNAVQNEVRQMAMPAINQPRMPLRLRQNPQLEQTSYGMIGPSAMESTSDFIQQPLPVQQQISDAEMLRRYRNPYTPSF